jgi:peptide/nickel transport system permease protein
VARYLIRRVGTTAVTTLVLSFVVFVLVEVSSPVSVCRRILGRFATDEQVRDCNVRLGLDHPLWDRYLTFLHHAVTLNFGVSTLLSQPVMTAVVPRLERTLVLALIAFFAIMPLGIVLGTFAALRQARLTDRAVTVAGTVTTAIPEIATGIFLLTIFSGELHLLPGAVVLLPGESLASHPSYFVLPVLTLMLVDVGYIARITRSSMLEVLRSNYVRTAELKGLSYRKVVRRHVLRNGMLVPVTVIAYHVNWLIGGVVIVEAVFGYPGLGQLLLQAAYERDVFVIEAGMLILVVVALVSQMLADIAYMLLDPRVRLT